MCQNYVKGVKEGDDGEALMVGVGEMKELKRFQYLDDVLDCVQERR